MKNRNTRKQCQTEMSDEIFDAAVIGGGPIGGFTALQIAKAGFRIAVIEEHIAPGEPVQCAGLISPRCLDIADFCRHTVLGEMKGADIHSPAGKPLSIGGDRVQALVIDRAAFDRAIIEHAIDSGAVFISGCRVKDIERGPVQSVALPGKTLKARLIIGADGARSVSGRSLGLGNPERILNGFTADVAGLDIEQDRVKVFFGRNLAPNFFAWMIPAGDVTRVGLCVRDAEVPVHAYFKKLFREGPAAGMLSEGRILGKHSGIIPLGTLEKTFTEGGMVVGDAAGQVKATSGGGIYPGLVCAGLCAKTATEALGEDNLSEGSLAVYQEAWTRNIGDELKKAMMMHRIFSNMDDRELEDVFGMLSNPDILDTVNRVGDIDYPSRLGWLLLRKEPGFLRYAGKFLRHGILDL